MAGLKAIKRTARHTDHCARALLVNIGSSGNLVAGYHPALDAGDSQPSPWLMCWLP